MSPNANGRGSPLTRPGKALFTEVRFKHTILQACGVEVNTKHTILQACGVEVNTSTHEREIENKGEMDLVLSMTPETL